MPLDDIDSWSLTTYSMLLEMVLRYQPLQTFHGSDVEITHSNIILIGQIQAGKSSFFDTIDTALIGQLSKRAATTKDGKSATIKFHSFQLYGPKGENVNVRVFDMRGLEESESLQLKDIEMILDGHIHDGYVFDVRNPITEESEYFRSNPRISDKVHCVLYCIDDQFKMMRTSVKDQMIKIRQLVKQRGTSERILLTKVDNLHERLEKEIPMIFKSKDVRKSIKEAAEYMKVDEGCVLPMKNYSREQYKDTNINILALRNLLQILRACDDYLAAFRIDVKTYWRAEGQKIIKGQIL